MKLSDSKITLYKSLSEWTQQEIDEYINDYITANDLAPEDIDETSVLGEADTDNWNDFEWLAEHSYKGPVFVDGIQGRWNGSYKVETTVGSLMTALMAMINNADGLIIEEDGRGVLKVTTYNHDASSYFEIYGFDGDKKVPLFLGKKNGYTITISDVKLFQD